MRKEMVVFVSVAAMVVSGCGAILPDHVTIATAEGLRAEHDGRNGMLSEDRGRAYFMTRNHYEAESTERGKCNALAALFGKCPHNGGKVAMEDK